MSILNANDDAKAIEQVEDHGAEDLKSLADHFVNALAMLGETHSVEFHASISITKKEQ